MDRRKRYAELVQKRDKARIRLSRAKKSLDHPHGQWQSSHDLAESEYKVLTDYIEGLEKEIEEIRGR